jgi:hypothetical protein
MQPDRKSKTINTATKTFIPVFSRGKVLFTPVLGKDLRAFRKRFAR